MLDRSHDHVHREREKEREREALEKFETRNEDAVNFGSDSTEASGGLDGRLGLKNRRGEGRGTFPSRGETRSTFAHAYE